MSIEEKLVEALNHIVWIPYCGIDGPDETGVYKNWPEEERDAMYKIAVETLIDVGLLSDNMKNAANRIEGIKMLNENQEELKFIVKVNGQVRTSPLLRKLAEAAVLTLPENERSLAELVPVTKGGKELLLET